MRKLDVYQRITDRIVKSLNEGVIPWRQPWNTFLPTNYISKKEYNGINFLVLSSYSFKSPYFLTFNQCKKLDGSIIKGSKGIPIVFWKIIEPDDGGDPFPLIKTSSVFNLTQTSLYDESKEEIKEIIVSAEDLVKSMQHLPEIKNVNNNRCYYLPLKDYISVVNINRFNSMDKYYSTLFHEIIHSTGHQDRLNRFMSTDKDDNEYGYEELVAEIGAAFLCAKSRIDNTLDSSAAYIDGWLKSIEGDSSLIIKASSDAQKAVNYLLGIEHDQQRNS